MLLAPDAPDWFFRERTLVTWLNSGQLFVAGLLATALWELSPSAAERRSNHFWLLVGLFLIYAAFDEYLEYHEHLGLWLGRQTPLRAPWPLANLDDVVLLAYCLLTLVLARFFWRRLLAGRLALGLLLFGSTVLAASQTMDMLSSDLLFYRRALGVSSLWAMAVEESLKFIASGFFLAAVIEYARIARLSIATPPAGPASPRLGRPIMLCLLILHLGVLVFALVQGVAQDDAQVLPGGRALLFWFSSLDRFGAATFAVAIGLPGGSRSMNGVPSKAFWFLVAAILLLSAAQLGFAISRERELAGGHPLRVADIGTLLLSMVPGAVLGLVASRRLHEAGRVSRRALALWAGLALAGIALDAAWGLPLESGVRAFLDVGAIAAGYMATFLLFWGLYAWYSEKPGRFGTDTVVQPSAKADKPSERSRPARALPY